MAVIILQHQGIAQLAQLLQLARDRRVNRDIRHYFNRDLLGVGQPHEIVQNEVFREMDIGHVTVGQLGKAKQRHGLG
jgi:hypothetical protein